MPDPKNTAASSERPQPPPVTYVNPRRTSPQNSITLKHHRLGREASKRHFPHIPNVKAREISSPRRNSSGESNETGFSDPKKWFDHSNHNALGNLDTTAMDVDPPFYQRETDSSNEHVTRPTVPTQSPAYRFLQNRAPNFRPGLTHSSSADDYRSVIDDLTIENKRLKEELKKYKQMGPDSLRRDKLFEVKVHGLPSRKKRELEAALRDFTTSLDGSTIGDSPRKKSIGKSKNAHSSASKHPSSTSGSNSRPVDSAYASMSQSGPSSTSVPPLPGQATAARHRSNLNIQNYLRDIPEGLWPRPTVMDEKEKKKLVVKRLEQLFTGKGISDMTRYPLPMVAEPIEEDAQMEDVSTSTDKTAPLLPSEAAREAQIKPRELRAHESQSHSRDNISSNSYSHGDQSDPRDTGNGSGSGSGHTSGGLGNTTSPQNVPPPEQRPTRPRDLDPDRQQVPSENMDYIRHLGLVAPGPLQQYSRKDVSPDAEGWVYLNLLCNLAQLHIFNVTPDFIRQAVSEKSAKFQLSPDGRKIRWRGGADGTRFSSDNSSGSTSQRNHSSDETDGSNEQDQRKRQKTQPQTNDVMQQKPSKFNLGVQESSSSENFHYKPMFRHHQSSSSEEQPTLAEGSGSSNGPPEESNLGGHSRWGQSGVSGLSMPPRKRRRDGAIIYYSGAPFCTDLSGDLGEKSLDTYEMTSSGDRDPATASLDFSPPRISRTTSGSSLPFRPLSGPASYGAAHDLDDAPELTSGETDDDIEADFPWADSEQQATLLNLEASGIGGVCPDDHFVVVVSTHRPKTAVPSSASSSDGDDDKELSAARPRLVERPSEDTTDSKTTTESIAGKLANMSTTSPIPFYVSNNMRVPPIDIEYISAKVRRLPPVPLPPPAFYYPSDDSDFSDDESEDGIPAYLSESLLSKRVILEESPGTEGDLSGNDEEDEHSDDERDYDASGSISPDQAIPNLDIRRPCSTRSIRGLSKVTGSSVATAGGAASGYNSSMEEV
ncbi:frequency clock protein [Xylariomycetidae sp. FL2044]|nr:frequency clock protein [Xylariomycetidae sp. FL2044]